MSAYRFYIGTHASAGQDTICLCEADFHKEIFRTLETVQEISDPTYLADSPLGTLYALGRTPEGGRVYALKEMAVMNYLPSGGSGPCHISVDQQGEFLLCADYGSGCVSLFDLNWDGSIRSLCDFRQYTGIGFDSKDRQKCPHAHYAVFHQNEAIPGAMEVLVCDLGLDMVYVYELDRAARKLKETERSIRLPNGAGPRHLVFNDQYPGMLFVLAEMANTLFTYRFDPSSKQYEFVQEISAVSDGASGVCPPDEALMKPSTADNGSIGCAIRITKDGKYLFVSSRLGYQSISAFRCEPDGKLSLVSRCLCGGITPRDFNLFEGEDPAEENVFLLVANQDSDLITALKFDRGTEKLSPLEMKMQAVKPTCILPI